MTQPAGPGLAARTAAALARLPLFRIRAPLFWRCVYGILARPATVASTAAVLRRLERRRPGVTQSVDAALHAAFGTLWPPHSPAYANLDVDRFLQRVGRRAAGGRDRAVRRIAARAPGRPLRIGVLGPFSGALSFGSRDLYAVELPGVELALFDLAYEGRCADYLRDLCHEYHAFAEPRPADVAASIEAAHLDVLVNYLHKQPILEILDLLETPCVVQLCGGLVPIEHARIDFSLNGSPQVAYQIVDNRFFCTTSRAWFGPERVVLGGTYYDGRDIDTSARRLWSDREPVVVYHGSLYKAAFGTQYLEVVLGLLQDDRELRYVLVGKDDGGALATIRAAAERRGVGDRVEYRGAFSSLRAADGTVEDDGWHALRELVGRARLAPNPFPLGGGSARAEWYGLGAPSPQLDPHFEREWWGRPQPAAIRMPAFATQANVARTLEEYRELCRRCLCDGVFADRVAAEQAEVFDRLTDPRHFWRELLGSYEDWRRFRRIDTAQ